MTNEDNNNNKNKGYKNIVYNNSNNNNCDNCENNGEMNTDEPNAIAETKRENGNKIKSKSKLKSKSSLFMCLNISNGGVTMIERITSKVQNYRKS